MKNLEGNPFVGVFACTTEEYTFLPHNASDEFVELVKEVLGTDPIKLSLASSNLIGVFLLANSNGAVVPMTTYTDELQPILEHLPVSQVSGYTALGNLAACNDKGCVVSPELSEKTINIIRETLDVRTHATTISGMDITGSSVVATNKGFLANINATDEDMDKLAKIFDVPGSTGTLNYGNPFVKGGILANSRGAIVGTTTTPFELSRIDDALFLDR